MNKPVESGVAAVMLTVNGTPVRADRSRSAERLSEYLRDELGLTGTKVGCHAGDCGACTVLLDGEQACACIVAVGQCEGRTVQTVEGLALREDGASAGGLTRLQQCFVAHGAAQCGICTPGMLMAAADTLARHPHPTEAQVLDGIGGVLCRCTGYRKIVEAVLAAGAPDRGTVEVAAAVASLPAGAAVGARLERFDARAKVTGAERYGADEAPEGALWLRVVRSPHASATFEYGDLEGWVAAHPGVAGVVTAADIPVNRFAIFPDLRDQPAIAAGEVRLLGEAVLVLAGDRAALERIDPTTLPLRYTPREAIRSPAQALAPGAHCLHERWPDNVLCRGRVVRGTVDAVLPQAPIRLSMDMTTSHVEHAYIEPEAGWAQWHDASPAGIGAAGSGADTGAGVTVFACTQTPYMDRDELAWMFALEPASVRIIPSAVGGGFGGKLDMSIQPLLVAAARKFRRPVRIVYTRPESMVSTTKRHPARMSATLGADDDGRFLAYDFAGDFDTGAYSSWGPTVANRVPIHATGPYRVQHMRALTRAVYTNNAIAGAFRGFGVPQSTLINETLIDRLACALGKDPLELRHEQALRAGDVTPTGQTLHASVGLQQCLAALRPAWRRMRAQVEGFNATATGAVRQGVGIACMWYGIGNTVIANPSSMTIGLRRTGRFMLYNGAVDIGQGTYTIMPQIAADALGVPIGLIDQTVSDTALTLDAGKSSASRQTFVSGNAARLAGEDLRRKLAALLGLEAGATLRIEEGELIGHFAGRIERRELASLAVDARGDIALGAGYFNPPTIALDADGQGVPYASYGFAAQFAQVEVDTRLGTVKVLSIHAAHDVGRAINPTQVEGQIHGGIAQGLGLALMEEYHAGKTDNLHDYLIPSAGDIPPIVVHLIEDPEPLGPYGAKGVGEPALVATAPAILNAVHHATGVRMTHVPATPDRVRQALRERDGANGPIEGGN